MEVTGVKWAFISGVRTCHKSHTKWTLTANIIYFGVSTCLLEKAFFFSFLFLFYLFSTVLGSYETNICHRNANAVKWRKSAHRCLALVCLDSLISVDLCFH